MRIDQLHLHETGDRALDRITIEHNAPLIDPISGLTVAHLIDALTRAPVSWQELGLPGVAPALALAAGAAGLAIEYDRVNPRYEIDLAAVRAAGTPWLDTLSANSRAQLRRATREAERAGPLRLDQAGSADEALAWFAALSPLHEARWQEAGAFSTEPLRRFHRAAIAAGHTDGTVELLRATSGDTVLGYLYQLSAHGVVSAYQSGYRAPAGNHDRPGLVLQRLAIEHALAQGAATYDLLAGDARYKQSLADPVEGLVWCRAQRPHPGLMLERLARKAVARMRRRGHA